jgi:rhodanese-related sulfurtransferase
MTGQRTIAAVLEGARARLERLDPHSAYEATRQGALLIDTRCGDARRSSGVIPGSVHVPLSVLYWRLDPTSGHSDPALSDPHRQVILVCAHGYSSSLAAATLHDLGFAGATDVVGGFEAWAAAGLPVEPAPSDRADRADRRAGDPRQPTGRVSRIRARTTRPETAVIAATTQIAATIPARSATAPATTAPTAKPRSRQSR